MPRSGVSCSEAATSRAHDRPQPSTKLLVIHSGAVPARQPVPIRLAPRSPDTCALTSAPYRSRVCSCVRACACIRWSTGRVGLRPPGAVRGGRGKHRDARDETDALSSHERPGLEGSPHGTRPGDGAQEQERPDRRAARMFWLNEAYRVCMTRAYADSLHTAVPVFFLVECV